MAAAKVTVEFANRNTKLTIVGGGLAGQLIDAAGVRELALLPSLDELRGKLVGLLHRAGDAGRQGAAGAGRAARAGARRACRKPERSRVAARRSLVRCRL